MNSHLVAILIVLTGIAAHYTFFSPIQEGLETKESVKDTNDKAKKQEEEIENEFVNIFQDELEIANQQGKNIDILGENKVEYEHILNCLQNRYDKMNSKVNGNKANRTRQGNVKKNKLKNLLSKKSK